MGSYYIVILVLMRLLMQQPEQFKLDSLPFDPEFRKPLAGQKIDIEQASDPCWIVGMYESKQLKSCRDFVATELIANRIPMRDCNTELAMAMAAEGPQEVIRKIRHEAERFERVSDEKCCKVVPISK